MFLSEKIILMKLNNNWGAVVAERSMSLLHDMHGKSAVQILFEEKNFEEREPLKNIFAGRDQCVEIINTNSFSFEDLGFTHHLV